MELQQPSKICAPVTLHWPRSSLRLSKAAQTLCRVYADVLHELWITACHLHHLGGPVEGAQRLAGSPAARGQPAALHDWAPEGMAEAACLLTPHCWPATR